MRLTASVFVYLLCGTSIISLVALGVYLILSPTNEYATFMNSFFHNHVLSNIVGGVCLVLGVVIAVTVCCFRDRLELGSSIVKVSTRFVNENCPVMLVQVGIFVAMTMFVVLWFFEALGFYSMGEPQYEPNSLPFQHFQSSWQVKALGFIHLFYFLWGMLFFVQTGDFLVSGTVTSWYFLREDPYKESIKRYLGFHIGSVCFGSFMIALFGFLKFLNELLSPKEEDSQDGCMRTVNKIWNCCCCLCVNWIFNWVNSGAYTFIHLSGDNYCTSAT